MWQIQWIMNLIPDSMLSLICWAVIVAGITGLFAAWIGKFIPFYGKYTSILKPVGIVLLVIGVWLRGGMDVELAWRAKVADLEAKLLVVKQESSKVNTVVETKVVTKTKIIKERAAEITKYVDREVIKEIVKFDQTCPIPKEAIEVHNEAARMNQAIEELKKGAKK